MKMRPIGVWFSAALVILVLGAWAGGKAGSGISIIWYRHQQRVLEKSFTRDRAQIELELSQLSEIGASHVHLLFGQADSKDWKQYLERRIEALEKEARQPETQGVRPVLELDLALTYVDASMAESRDNNRDLADKYMQSAQGLFQSLGWRDYSEGTLKIVAQHDLDKWNPKPQERQPGK
jgi:hypothetical protein